MKLPTVEYVPKFQDSFSRNGVKLDPYIGKCFISYIYVCLGNMRAKLWRYLFNSASGVGIFLHKVTSGLQPRRVPTYLTSSLVYFKLHESNERYIVRR